MRCRNSSVLARISASVSFWISGSSALMAWTFGISALMTRSFFVPKTLPNRVLIKLEFLQRGRTPNMPLKPSTFDASRAYDDAGTAHFSFKYNDGVFAGHGGPHDCTPLLADSFSHAAGRSRKGEGQEETFPAGIRVESEHGSGGGKPGRGRARR